MKACFIALLALGITGCGARSTSHRSDTGPTHGSTTFPIGTYTNCAQGVRNLSGNVFLNGSGFLPGTILTLTQSGTTVESTYAFENGGTQSLSFSTTTGTSAILAPAGQVIPAATTALCVMGPGNETGHPAAMTTRDGVLVSDAGMVFMSVTGSLESEAGACGTLSEPEASFWLICEDRKGGALPSMKEGSPPLAPPPAGQHSCGSQVNTHAEIDGIGQFVTSGGSGTLTLTEDGATASAEYAGDRYLAGTLRLDATTGSTANVEAGGILMTPCAVPIGTQSQTLEPLPIPAGVLAVLDSTLLLSFAGTLDDSSTCPGAQVAGSVICPL